MYTQQQYQNLPGGNIGYQIPQSIQVQRPQQVVPEAIIELKAKHAKKIRKVVDDNERILYAGMIEKINEDGVEQDRIIIITNNHVYNVDPNDGFFAKLAMCSTSGMAVKRKIKVTKIYAVTVSMSQLSLKNQFVIHVQDGHDYRFNGGFSREKVLKSLLHAHFCHTIDPLFLHTKEEADLKEYQTTESEASSKKSRRPKEVPIFVGPELAANGINWILANRFQLLANKSRLPSNVPVQQIQQVQQPRPTGFSSQPNYPSQVPQNKNQNTYQQPTFQNNNNNGGQNGGYNKPQFYIPEITQQQGNFQGAPVQQQQGNFQASPIQQQQGNYQAPSNQQQNNFQAPPVQQHQQQQGQGQQYAQPNFGYQQRPSEGNDFERLIMNNGNANYNVQINTFTPPK